MLALKNSMIKYYNSHAYTHVYIFGFVYNHQVFAVRTNSDILCQVLKLDKASRGQGYALRFRPTREIKALLMSMDAEIICSELYFNQLVKASKYNKGEIFEMLITERAGLEWVKDSVPFTDDGDVTIDGVAYQVKYENATFINEGQIARMERRAAQVLRARSRARAGELRSYGASKKSHKKEL